MNTYGGNLKCKTCGAEGDCGGTIPECIDCWEVEKRLDWYLKSRKGIRFVLDKLKNIELSDENYYIRGQEVKSSSM